MPNAVLQEVARRVRDREPLRASLAVRLFLASGTQRYWSGIGPITVGAETFSGFGELLSVSGLSAAAGGAALPFALSLSGLPAELGPQATAAASEWQGRRAQIGLLWQDGETGQVIGLNVMRTGAMESLKRSRNSAERVNLEVTCEGLFTDRKQSRWAFGSDRDQQARQLGDRGYEHTSAAERELPPFPVLT